MINDKPDRHERPAKESSGSIDITEQLKGFEEKIKDSVNQVGKRKSVDYSSSIAGIKNSLGVISWFSFSRHKIIMSSLKTALKNSRSKKN